MALREQEHRSTICLFYTNYKLAHIAMTCANLPNYI